MFDQGLWHGKRVVVTGHTGFKGAWLSFWLNMMGAKVVGISLEPDTEPSLFSALNLKSSTLTKYLDIRNLDHFDEALKDLAPDLIFHLAAQSLVRRSYRDPVGTYATNVMGTVHCLEVARRHKDLCGVLAVTSDKCYENREVQTPYIESDPMGGRDPYSSSKGCSELVAASYRKSFFDGAEGTSSKALIASARAGNVIGGGDWAEDRLIPDMVRAWHSKKPVMIRNPKSVRPWQHVLEPLSGYIKLGEKMLRRESDVAEGWNFAPQEFDSINVESVVKIAADVWGPDAKWNLDGGAHPHEANLLKLSAKKAEEKLGWRPRWRVDRAIAESMTWYREYYSNPSKAPELCRKQIESYIKS